MANEDEKIQEMQKRLEALEENNLRTRTLLNELLYYFIQGIEKIDDYDHTHESIPKTLREALLRSFNLQILAVLGASVEDQMSDEQLIAQVNEFSESYINELKSKNLDLEEEMKEIYDMGIEFISKYINNPSETLFTPSSTLIWEEYEKIAEIKYDSSKTKLGRLYLPFLTRFKELLEIHADREKETEGKTVKIKEIDEKIENLTKLKRDLSEDL